MVLFHASAKASISELTSKASVPDMGAASFRFSEPRCQWQEVVTLVARLGNIVALHEPSTAVSTHA